LPFSIVRHHPRVNRLEQLRSRAFPPDGRSTDRRHRAGRRSHFVEGLAPLAKSHGAGLGYPRLVCSSRRLLVISFASAWLGGCPGRSLVLDAATTADAASDAADIGADARSPTPLDIAIDDPGHARLVVETDPIRFRIERPDGSVLVRASRPGALEFGTASGGDTRYHRPIDPDPIGVTWRALDFGLTRTSDSSAVVANAAGRTATITLTRPEAGVLRMRLEGDSALTDVALARIRLDADDGSYQGLGERFEGADARGRIVPMQFVAADPQARESGTNEHHVPVPFLVDSRGWGVFVESREAGAFDVAATDANEVRSTFEGRVLDVFFFVAGTPRDIIAAYTRHTGLPILPPRWAFAPMHWRNEWTSRAQLETEMATIRSLHIPCTAFWIDNPWEASYNDFVFDETRFPMSAQMITGMRTQGFRPLLWSAPYLDAVAPGATPTNTAEQLYVMALANDWLVHQGGGVYQALGSALGADGPSGMIDFTNPTAVAFWQSRIAPRVADGVRGFKLDYGEEIVPELVGSRVNFRFFDGTTERQTHGVYDTLYHTPYRRALDEGSMGEGGFLLVRAEAWGGQGVADIIWPGDLDNDFSRADARNVGGLPAAISGMISLASSGFPNYGSDTGGFRGGMPTREALLRWAEHTAFSQILQLGGGGDHHDPWLYDTEAGDIYRVLARAHMDLVPYLRMNAIAAHTNGTPTVLHPSLAYPDDRAGYTDPDAYLLGDDLFVAPVVSAGTTSRSLHLPPGRWVHYFTGARYDGPADITVDAPIGITPAFVRVGAIVPMLPDDLDTLVDVSAPLVGPSTPGHQYLRARILPAIGMRAITTEEGAAIALDRTETAMTFAVTPGRVVQDVRMAIELAHADPVITAVVDVRAGGTSVAARPDAASVRGGCDGVCWFRDGDVLWLSVRSSSATNVTITTGG
jgi:alpha-D-xyloside xylohydrolase